MEELSALGLDPEEVTAYLDLLRGREVPEQDASVWDGLVGLGLVRRGPDGPTAAPPRPPLERWAVAREQEAAQARDVATALAQLHEAGVREESFVEVLRGREASRAVYESLQSGARGLVRAWDRGAYGVPVQTGAPTVTREALARGVRYQVVYDGSTLAGDGMMAVLTDSAHHGEEARIFPQLMKMVIADEDRAFIALPARQGEVDSVLVHPSLLLDALVALFTMVWEMAVPASPTPGTDEPEDAHVDDHLLSMLSAGMTDAAIARSLGVSSRTVARRVGRLQDRLGARSRFQLAALAARRGWL